MSTPQAAATDLMRAGGPTSTGTMSLRRADSTAPSSESRSHGWTTAQLTASSGAQRTSRRANTSFRRSTISGVAISEYASLPRGASTTTVPQATRRPAALTSQSKSTRPEAACLRRAVTVAAISSPT